MRITLKEAAELLEIREQTLRIGLQQSRFPFGVAIETGKGRYTYCIWKDPLLKYLAGEMPWGGMQKGETTL